VTVSAVSFLQDPQFIRACYIVSFALFIYGLMNLRGPRTAVRGNAIAAVGMGIAIVATLLMPGMGRWALIVLGIAIGTVIGVPAARNVKMTAMPQMVALFNGVGGGAVALVAWAEFRQAGGDVPGVVGESLRRLAALPAPDPVLERLRQVPVVEGGERLDAGRQQFVH